nr:MAG TPA: Melittin [Caudoviricetes sp.]
MNTSAAGYHRKPLSALWSWIKSKMDDEIITITKSITITTE